jgi:hypothetical protein
LSSHLNGEELSIKGKVCQGHYLNQHQEGESITDQVNVALFKFDGETIIWRNYEKPSEPVNDRLSTCLVLLNICEFEGVVEHILNNIEYGGDNKHVWAKLEFSRVLVLHFEHNRYDDYASVNF